MRDFIERLRAHPVHIRQRIALGTTLGVTGLVALIWIVSLGTSGTLALDLNSPTSVGGSDDTTLALQSTTTPSKSHLSQLLGAIGAIHTNQKPALSSVEATSTNTNVTASQNTTDSSQSTNMNDTNQTTIQF